MKFFLSSLIVFLATLLAAALVALGEPAHAELAVVREAQAPEPLAVARWLGLR